MCMFDSKDLMRNFIFMLVLLPGAWRFIADGHMYVVGTRYMYPATIIAHEVVLIYMAAHCQSTIIICNAKATMIFSST